MFGFETRTFHKVIIACLHKTRCHVFFEDPVELGTVIFREAYGHHL